MTERSGGHHGAAQAVIRDRLWILSLLTVSPTLGRAVRGARWSRRPSHTTRGTDAGMIIASNDPRALRLYGSSGFALEPTFQVTGTVDPR